VSPGAGGEGPQELRWFDAHCHLDTIGEDDPAAIDAALVRARAAGVRGLVTIGTDLASSRAAAEIAGERAGVWAAVGIHPHDATTLDDAVVAELLALASVPKVVAIGEIGLDYFRDLSPRDVQREAFRRQLALARLLGKAVVIHMRDAHADVFATLEEVGPPERLVFHCFSGGPDDARRALDLGGYISFAGNISYKNADNLREAAAVVPPDRILVETDSPFLAPMPHRGKPNEPAFVPFVGIAVAAALNIPPESLATWTVANTIKVFALPGVVAS
jgi:TatD DNase family protein